MYFCISVYMDFVDDNTPIQLIVRIGTAAGVSRKWNMRICQIACASAERGWYFNQETDFGKGGPRTPRVICGHKQLIWHSKLKLAKIL
jgi:hypothetical protein